MTVPRCATCDLCGARTLRKGGEPDPGRRHPGRWAAVPADAPVEAAGCRRGRRPRTGGQRDPVPGVWAGPGRRRPGSFVARPGRAGAGSVHTPSAAVASSPSVVGPVCTPAATHHGPSVLAPVRAARAQPSCRHLHLTHRRWLPVLGHLCPCLVGAHIVARRR